MCAVTCIDWKIDKRRRALECLFRIPGRSTRQSLPRTERYHAVSKQVWQKELEHRLRLLQQHHWNPQARIRHISYYDLLNSSRNGNFDVGIRQQEDMQCFCLLCRSTLPTKALTRAHPSIADDQHSSSMALHIRSIVFQVSSLASSRKTLLFLPLPGLHSLVCSDSSSTVSGMSPTHPLAPTQPSNHCRLLLTIFAVTVHARTYMLAGLLPSPLDCALVSQTHL